MIKEQRAKNPMEIFENIIVLLSQLHNAGEYHGGSQIKNFTYSESKIYFIDFEESFSSKAHIDDLQFRDLFLFLFSISKENIKVDFDLLVHTYIDLTEKTDTIEKFQLLISKVRFLLKIIKNTFIWRFLDRDTKSVYRLLKALEYLTEKGIDNA
jgi:tRNA A-37 threonylcarbamoyl transferase component Bud32